MDRVVIEVRCRCTKDCTYVLQLSRTEGEAEVEFFPTSTEGGVLSGEDMLHHSFRLDHQAMRVVAGACQSFKNDLALLGEVSLGSVEDL